MKNPIQPIIKDENGVLRFKKNSIVAFLIDWSTKRGIGMNELALMGFSNDDRQQFAQLIGYSLSGYSELSYVDDISYNTVIEIYENKDERDAYIAALEQRIYNINSGIEALREPIANLFGVHQDDLNGNFTDNHLESFR